MKAFILASSASSLKNFRGHLILKLVSEGISVHACAPDIDQDHETRDWLDSNSITFHNAPFSRTGLNPISDLVGLFRLRKLLTQVKPDIFLSYTVKPVIWGGIAARMAAVPKRVALITGLGYAFTGVASGKRWFIQRIVRRLYQLSLKGMHQIFFQNPDDKIDFEKLGVLPLHVPIDIVNGSGVDINKYAVEPLPSKPLKFLLIARLLGDKGIREYVLAASEIKRNFVDVEFHLVGGLDTNPDGLKEDEVKAWANQGYIIWHGQQRDVRSFIANSHVYVLPSYREGTPRTVLEAMSMGRAIITTDAPGCRETVIADHNGYLVPIQSVEPLVKAMMSFINYPNQIVSMGRNSRQLAEAKYDVHKVNEFMLSIILNIRSQK